MEGAMNKVEQKRQRFVSELDSFVYSAGQWLFFVVPAGVLVNCIIVWYIFFLVIATYRIYQWHVYGGARKQ